MHFEISTCSMHTILKTLWIESRTRKHSQQTEHTAHFFFFEFSGYGGNKIFFATYKKRKPNNF